MQYNVAHAIVLDNMGLQVFAMYPMYPLREFHASLDRPASGAQGCRNAHHISLVVSTYVRLQRRSGTHAGEARPCSRALAVTAEDHAQDAIHNIDSRRGTRAASSSYLPSYHKLEHPCPKAFAASLYHPLRSHAHSEVERGLYIAAAEAISSNFCKTQDTRTECASNCRQESAADGKEVSRHVAFNTSTRIHVSCLHCAFILDSAWYKREPGFSFTGRFAT
eukprot:1555068-Pleurochrysis_carterae.AAC.1